WIGGSPSMSSSLLSIVPPTKSARMACSCNGLGSSVATPALAADEAGVAGAATGPCRGDWLRIAHGGPRSLPALLSCAPPSGGLRELGIVRMKSSIVLAVLALLAGCAGNGADPRAGERECPSGVYEAPGSES